jgi:cytochrome b
MSISIGNPSPRNPTALRCLHLGLVVLCLLAWATAQFAGDYKRPVHTGYTLHEIVGILFAAILSLRVVYGVFGPKAARFAAWFPLSASNRALIAEDLRLLARLRLPERQPHEGIAGLVEALGLLAFFFIAGTGVAMALYLEPGARAGGWLRGVKEVHEIAQTVIPAYLALHAGAALLHALAGHDLLRDMFFLSRKRRLR